MIGTRALSLGDKANLLLWLVLLVLMAGLVSMPTSIQVQATLGIAAVIVVALLKPVAMESMVARFAMMAIASTLVMRYWAWRVTETLPPVDDLISFIPAVILFIVETYAIGVFFLSAFMTADPVKRGLPPKVAARDLPTVDILVPSYNEPIEMLAITLSAAKNMHYPVDKRTVVLCDDGGTDQRCNHEDPKIAEGRAQAPARPDPACATSWAWSIRPAPATNTPRPATCRRRWRSSTAIWWWCSTPTTFPAAISWPARWDSLSRTPSCSWCRRRTSSSTPIRSTATSASAPTARRKTRCSITSATAGWTAGAARSSAARRHCCGARRWTRRAALPVKPSPRTPKPRWAFTATAGNRSMSITR